MHRKKISNNIILSVILSSLITGNLMPIVSFADGEGAVVEVEQTEGTKQEESDSEQEEQEESDVTEETGPIKTVYDFVYTGEVQEFTAPFDGVYLLEAWGAEGGNNIMYPTLNNNGGYAKGQYKMTKGDKLYVYVGSKGQDEMSDKDAHTNVLENGGWNGGGNGKGAGSGGGGGATDFRTENQDVNLEFTSGSEDDKRILVAGGGGGLSPTYRTTNYEAEGVSGGNTVGRAYYDTGRYSSSTAKSNVANDVLSKTNIAESASSYVYGGGGGGYRGGKSYTANYSSVYTQYYYPKGVGGLNSTRGVGASSEMTGINTSVPHPAGGTQTGNSGHGYARITLLNNAPELTLTNTIREGMEVVPKQEITINGTISDEISNNMMVYYQLDDNEPVQAFKTSTTAEQVPFTHKFNLPEELSSGVHTISVWSEDDAGGIGKRQQFKIYYLNDDEQPIFTDITLSPDTWVKGTVDIKLKVNDYYPIKNITTPDNKTTTNTDITYNVKANGTYLFKANMINGNVKEVLVDVDNIDTTAPTVNYTLDYDGFTDNNVTIKIDASDTQSGIASIQTPDGKIVENTNTVEYEVSENKTYRFVVTDKVGNVTNKDVVISKIDKNMPTMTLSKNTTALAKEVTITVNVTSLSDITKIILPDGREVANVKSTTFKATENKEYTFTAINAIGHEVTQSITIDHIDNTPPDAEIDFDTEWTNKDLIVRIVANDDYKVQSIKMPNNSVVNDTYGMYTITANGTYNFVITDGVGNTTTKTINVTNIDKEGPTNTRLQSHSTWTKEDVVISFSVLDKGIGLEKVILPNGEEETSNVFEYTVSENGNYVFEFIDKLGNKSSVTVPITIIDRTPPTVTISDPVLSSTNIRLSINTSDSQSGMNTNSVTYIAPNNDIWTKSSGSQYIDVARTKEVYNGEWTIRAVDKVGNVTEKKIDISKFATKFDGTPPTLELTAVNVGNGQKMITAIAEDTNSGLDYIKAPNGTSYKNTPIVNYTVTANGKYTFEAADKYGNKTTQTINIGDVVDNNTELQLTLNTDKWTNTDVVITATLINPSSTVKHIKLPNGNMVKASTAIYVVKENGAYLFEAEDDLGNIYKNAIVVENIDRRAPVVEIINETEWTNENVDVTINAEDR